MIRGDRNTAIAIFFKFSVFFKFSSTLYYFKIQKQIIDATLKKKLSKITALQSLSVAESQEY